MYKELSALQMKGAAEGLRVIICVSNSFSIKGMRGVRKCRLFWSWEQESEVFFFLSFSVLLPLHVPLGVLWKPLLCPFFSGHQCVKQPAQC